LRPRHTHRLGPVHGSPRIKNSVDVFCHAAADQKHPTVSSLVASLVLSKFDYGISTLAGLPAFQLNRFQSVLNADARLVCSVRKYDHVTPLLRDLHWLRIPERITFRLSVLVYRRLSTGSSASTARSASTAALVVQVSRHVTIG